MKLSESQRRVLQEGASHRLGLIEDRLRPFGLGENARRPRGAWSG